MFTLDELILGRVPAVSDYLNPTEPPADGINQMMFDDDHGGGGGGGSPIFWPVSLTNNKQMHC